MKQNGTDFSGFIFVPPTDGEQSCNGLLEQSVSDYEEPYKHNPNQIRKGIRYVSDPVSCKQGLKVEEA